MPRPRRLLGATVVLAAVAAALTACGDPNAGDAASAELESFLDDHPVDGFEAVVERAENTLPFTGSLEVTMTAQDAARLDPDNYLAAMRSVAEQVCAFTPEADASVELRKARMRVGRLALRHPVALGDPDPLVSVTGPGVPPPAPATGTPGQPA